MALTPSPARSPFKDPRETDNAVNQSVSSYFASEASKKPSFTFTSGGSGGGEAPSAGGGAGAGAGAKAATQTGGSGFVNFGQYFGANAPAIQATVQKNLDQATAVKAPPSVGSAFQKGQGATTQPAAGASQPAAGASQSTASKKQKGNIKGQGRSDRNQSQLDYWASQASDSQRAEPSGDSYAQQAFQKGFQGGLDQRAAFGYDPSALAQTQQQMAGLQPYTQPGSYGTGTAAPSAFDAMLGGGLQQREAKTRFSQLEAKLGEQQAAKSAFERQQAADARQKELQEKAKQAPQRAAERDYQAWLAERLPWYKENYTDEQLRSWYAQDQAENPTAEYASISQ